MRFMGSSFQQSHYPTHDLKGTVLQHKGMYLKPSNLNDSLWWRSKVLRAQAMRRSSQRITRIICSRQQRRIRRISIKPRRAVRETSASKRAIYGDERRIGTLQKLVRNGNQHSINGGTGGGGGGGLDELFGETADYIQCLQMKVKIMQILVKLLSPYDH